MTATLRVRPDGDEATAHPPTPPQPHTAPGPLVTRRRLEIALGCLWLLDGLLQFQPYMFTRAFFQGILGMANMGLPTPVSSWDFRAADLLGAHFVFWNAAFASLQVLLGIGLLRRSTAKLARAVSIPWGLSVWVLGEGFGGMLMPGTGLLTGAPGAALLYSVLALVLWPRGESERGPVADHGLLGPAFAQVAWAALWVGGALLELRAVNHASSVPAAQLTNTGQGEPSLIAAFNRGIGHLVAGQGLLFASAVGVTALVVGAGVFVPGTRKVAIGLGLVAAVFFGIAGQDLGAMATGQGTDPGTGPLLVLFALALWPRPAVAASESRRSETGSAQRRPVASSGPGRREGSPEEIHAGA
jgi:hypothetical protein